MSKYKSELVVITKAKDLGSYIFTITDKSPKKFRFTLVSRMQNLSLDIIEELYRANTVFVKNSKDITHMEKRVYYQHKAYIDLKLLGYIALMSREQQCILPKQYEQISKQATEINQLLVSWVNSDRKRFQG